MKPCIYLCFQLSPFHHRPILGTSANKRVGTMWGYAREPKRLVSNLPFLQCSPLQLSVLPASRSNSHSFFSHSVALAQPQEASESIVAPEGDWVHPVVARYRCFFEFERIPGCLSNGALRAHPRLNSLLLLLLLRFTSSCLVQQLNIITTLLHHHLHHCPSLVARMQDARRTCQHRLSGVLLDHMEGLLCKAQPSIGRARLTHHVCSDGY